MAATPACSELLFGQTVGVNDLTIAVERHGGFRHGVDNHAPQPVTITSAGALFARSRDDSIHRHQCGQRGGSQDPQQGNAVGQSARNHKKGRQSHGDPKLDATRLQARQGGIQMFSGSEPQLVGAG